MKKLKKIILFSFGLLMFCLTLTLVNYKEPYQNPLSSSSNEVGTTALPNFQKLNGYNGGLRFVYSENLIFEHETNPVFIETLADLPADSEGNKVFYISIYLVIEYSTTSYTYTFNLNSVSYPYTYEIFSSTKLYEDSEAEYEKYDLKRDEIDALLEQYDEDSDEYAELEKERKEVNSKRTLYNNQRKALKNVNAGGKFSNHVFEENSSTLVIDGMQADGEPVVNPNGVGTTYDLLVGKIKVSIPASESEFLLKCNSFVPGVGDDNPSKNTNTIEDGASAALSDLYLKVGAGQQSNSIETVGTWQAGGISAPVNLVADHTNKTLTGTLPAEGVSGNITVNLTTDGGKGTNVLTGAGWSGTSNPYTVAVPAKGGSVTANVAVTAQDTTTTDTYTLTLNRRNTDFSSISITTDGSPSQTFSISDLVAVSDSTTEFNLPSNLNWDVKNLTVNVGVDSGQTLSAISGTSVGNYSASTTAGAIKFSITEHGVENEYTINYVRDAGDDDTTISSITVLNSGTQVTITGPTTVGTSKVYEISDVIPFDIQSLNYTVALNDVNNQHIEVTGDSNWNGTSAKSMSTAGDKGFNNTVDSNFEQEFKVYSQIGTYQTYVIKGVRAFKKSDSTEMTGTWSGNNNGPTNVTLVADHVNHTLKGVIPANCNSSTLTITLTTASNGTNDLKSSTNGSWSGTAGTYTVAVPAAGQSVEAVITAYAQSYHATLNNAKYADYTVTLERRSQDLTKIDVASQEAPSQSFPNLTETSGKFTISSPFSWDTENIKVTVHLVDSNKTTVKYNGTASNPFTANIGKPSATATSNGTISFDLVENGIVIATYEIEYDRDAGSDDKSIDALYVYNTSDPATAATPLALTGPTSIADNKIKYKITGNIPYNVTSLDFKVDIDTTLQYIKVSGDSNQWDGTIAKQFSTGSLGNTSDYTFTYEFYVYSQLGNGQIYVIEGVRDAANNDISLSGKLTGQKSTYVDYAFTTPQNLSSNTTLYEYSGTTALDEANVKFEFSVATTSKLYFGTSSNPTNLWDSTMANTPYLVGTYDSPTTYYVKVVAESGTVHNYVFKLAQPDNRNTDTTLSKLELKPTGSATPLVPVAAFGDSTTVSFNSSVYKYYYVINYNDFTSIDVSAIPTASVSGGVYADSAFTQAAATSITVANLKVASQGDNVFTFYVKSEAGTYGTPYEVHIRRNDGRTAAYLTDLKVQYGATNTLISVVTGTSDPSGTQYSVVVPYDTTSVTVSYGVADGATASPASSQVVAINNHKGILSVTVTSETGIQNTYTINIYATEEGVDITDIRLLDYDQSVDPSTGELKTNSYDWTDLVDADGNLYIDFATLTAGTLKEITVPYSVDKVYLYATSSKHHVVFSGLGTHNLTPNTPKFITVSAISHYASLTNDNSEKIEYKFKITRLAANTEKDIATFEAYTGPSVDPLKKIDSDDISFAHGIPTITVGNFDATQNMMTVRFTLDTPNNSTVEYNSAVITPDSDGYYVVNIPLGFDANGKAQATIHVIDEAKTPKPYTINVQTDPLTAPTMPTITNIIITGNYTGTVYLGNTLNPFNATQTTPLEIKLDKNETSVTVNVAISGATGSYKIEYTLVDGTLGDYVGSSGAITTNVGTTKVNVFPFTTTENGNAFTYNLKREQASTDNTISDVTINGETATPAAGLDFDLPNGTTSTTMTITPDDPNSTIQAILPDGTTVALPVNPTTGVATTNIPGLTPGANNVTIIVTPEDSVNGTPKTYPVTVNVDQPTTLKEITVESINGLVTYPLTGTAPNYTVNIPHDVDYVNVKYKLEDGIDSTKIVNPMTGTGIVDVTSSIPTHKIVVETTAGATPKTEYTINFVKETAKVGNKLLTVEIEIPDNNADGAAEVITISGFNPDKTSYDVALPANTSSYKFINVTVSDGATYTLDTNTTLTNNQCNTRTITVTSQSGLNNPYTFKLYVANTEAEITSIKVLNTAGTTLVDLDNVSLLYNASTKTYSLRVANSVSAIKLKVEWSVTATLNIDGQTFTSGNTTQAILLEEVGTTPNTITLQAFSQLYMLNNALTEANKSEEYKIEIVREDLDSDNTLKKLELYLTNSNLINGFVSNNFGPYNVGDLGSVGSVRLVAETTSPKAKIISVSQVSTGLNGTTFDGSVSLAGILDTTLTATLTVTVRAENGENQSYTILVSRGKIDPEKDNTVEGITLKDNNSKDYITFAVDKKKYEVTIPTGINYYTITVSKLNGSYASLHITDINGNELGSNGIYTENITSANWGQTVKYYAYAIAQDSTVGTKYEIEVTIEKPSDNNDLASLKVDGKELITTDNPVGPYSLAVPYETNEIKLNVKAEDENATLKVGTTKVNEDIYADEHYALKVGVNFITVEVFAEDGTSKQYEIEITRSAEAPKLDTLEVSGAYLRDDLGNRVVFDPETYSYNVIVPYDKSQVEIMATSTTGEVYGTGVKNVNVGTQDFSVQVVAPNGMATSYTLTINRLPASYSNAFAEFIRIQEIQEFNDAFKPTQMFGYSYTVPNKITDLTVLVELQFEDDNINDSLEATYEVYGDKNLRVGLNNVVVVVTSADGSNQSTYLVQVTREPKQYDVNNKDEAVKDYEIEQNKDTAGSVIENEYKVNIGKKKTSEVDFAKFIENLNPTNQNLEVEVISDISANPNEVVVKISDGDQVEFVKFMVESTGNPTGMEGEEWFFLILLGIILIILTAILISVNKDKYGKITKKTNKKTEKQDKKEEAKRK